jgi:hypothetical protein
MIIGQPNAYIVGSSQVIASNSSNKGEGHNSIDNLSTLRSSDINERERNLLEKVKFYKKENEKLISIMKASENAVAEKINSQKRETESILKVLKSIWPLLQNVAHQQIDPQTREVLAILGQMIGKNIECSPQQFSWQKDTNK